MLDQQLRSEKSIFSMVSLFFLGVQCGHDYDIVECHKYADCHYDMGNQEFSCRCLPGFKYDLSMDCVRAPSM